jgi:hypothetical protein
MQCRHSGDQLKKPLTWLDSVEVEETIRLQGRRKVQEDSWPVSDALMALLQLHRWIPASNSRPLFFASVLGTSLAAWASLAYTFPKIPGAIMLLPDIVAEEYRARFATFLLMSTSCHVTVVLLMFVLLCGSFGTQREEGLFLSLTVLIVTLIFHGTGLAGGERIYKTREGRPVSVWHRILHMNVRNC